MQPYSLTTLGSGKLLCDTALVENEHSVESDRRLFSWDIARSKATDLTAFLAPEPSQAMAEACHATAEAEEDPDGPCVQVERAQALSDDGRTLVVHLVLRIVDPRERLHVAHQLRSVDLARGRLVARADRPAGHGSPSTMLNADVHWRSLDTGLELAAGGQIEQRDHAVLQGLSRDGALAYFVGDDGIVAVETGDLETVAAELPLDVRPAWGVVCGERYAYVSEGRDQVRVVDLRDGSLRHSYALVESGRIPALHVARAASTVAIETGETGVVLLDVTTGEERRVDIDPALVDGGMLRIALSPDAETIVAHVHTFVRNPPYRLAAIDVATGATRPFRAKIPVDPCGREQFAVAAGKLFVPKGLTLRSTPLPAGKGGRGAKPVRRDPPRSVAPAKRAAPEPRSPATKGAGTLRGWKALLHAWNQVIFATEDAADLRATVKAAVRKSGWLGMDPASPEELEAAERKIGRELPKALRNFFLASNGWHYCPDSFVDRLFPAHRLRLLEATAAGRRLIAWKHSPPDGPAEPSEEQLERAIVIGATPDDELLLLVPDETDARADWELWDVSADNPGVERHPSLWAWIERQAFDIGGPRSRGAADRAIARMRAHRESGSWEDAERAGEVLDKLGEMDDPAVDPFLEEIATEWATSWTTESPEDDTDAEPDTAGEHLRFAAVWTLGTRRSERFLPLFTAYLEDLAARRTHPGDAGYLADLVEDLPAEVRASLAALAKHRSKRVRALYEEQCT